MSGNTGASGFSKFSPNSIPVSALDRNLLFLTGQETGTSYGTTSTTFVEVDSENFAGYISSRSGWVKLTFFGIGKPGTADIFSMSATVGGVPVHERGNNGLWYQDQAALNTCSFVAIAPCEGKQRVALTWRAHSGVAPILYCGTGNYCQFVVEEW